MERHDGDDELTKPLNQAQPLQSPVNPLAQPATASYGAGSNPHVQPGTYAQMPGYAAQPPNPYLSYQASPPGTYVPVTAYPEPVVVGVVVQEEDDTCAKIGCALSWLWPAGFITFLVNQNAPRGSSARRFANIACAVSTCFFVASVIVLAVAR